MFQRPKKRKPIDPAHNPDRRNKEMGLRCARRDLTKRELFGSRVEFLCQSGFSLRNYASKSRFVVNCQISQHAAIQSNVCFLQTGDQLAVAQTFSTGLSVDSRNLQSTEVALFNTTVTISVLTSFDNRLLGNSEHTRARSIVTFSRLQYF